MTKLLFDSWAIIEWFGNGPKANQIKTLFADNLLFTTVLNVYEVAYRLEQENGREKAEEAVKIIANRMTLLSIEPELALSAAQMRNALKASSRNLSSIDIITYAAAQSVGATLVTGDPDFKGVKDVKLF